MILNRLISQSVPLQIKHNNNEVPECILITGNQTIYKYTDNQTQNTFTRLYLKFCKKKGKNFLYMDSFMHAIHHKTFYTISPIILLASL